MNKRSRVAILVASTLMLSGGLALAAPSKPITIFSCLSSSGTLTKVSTKAFKCPKGTTSLSWNQAGPAGLQGPEGVQGSEGIQGPQGPQGVRGLQGLPGLAAPSAEVTVDYSLNGGSKLSAKTSFNGKFLKINQAMWPLVWGSGAFLPEFAVFRTTFPNTEESFATFAYSGLSCSGTPHAFIGVRNNVDLYLLDEIESTSWEDGLPPVPLAGEVRAIRGDFFRVSDNTFARESVRSWRDENGFCRPGKPYEDLYKLAIYDRVIVDYDEWDDPIYDDRLTLETPLHFVKVDLIAEIPEILGTSEMLEIN
jgi:hypothetical protein